MPGEDWTQLRRSIVWWVLGIVVSVLLMLAVLRGWF